MLNMLFHASLIHGFSRPYNLKNLESAMFIAQNSRIHHILSITGLKNTWPRMNRSAVFVAISFFTPTTYGKKQSWHTSHLFGSLAMAKYTSKWVYRAGLNGYIGQL